MFKISASEFGTAGMRRWMQTYADEFLGMATEGIVHGLHKVVTQSPFCVRRQRKASKG